jgi:hypothetical protein
MNELSESMQKIGGAAYGAGAGAVEGEFREVEGRTVG